MSGNALGQSRWNVVAGFHPIYEAMSEHVASKVQIGQVLVHSCRACIAAVVVSIARNKPLTALLFCKLNQPLSCKQGYPDAWLEEDRHGDIRLKRDARKNKAERIAVEPTGQIGTGAYAWFIPGKFRFCLNCKVVHSAQGKDKNRLAALSAEGRSSATTLLTHSVLHWMHSQESIPIDRRKMLGFTDNRQDAALQAGHFNDFLFVSLFRAAFLGAVESAGSEGLSADRLGLAVFKALGFERLGEAGLRSEWLIDSELQGANFVNAQKAMRQVLAYRAWFDQRRGWRFTNPNLEQLGLVRVDYIGLEELCANEKFFADAPPLIAKSTPEIRKKAYRVLLDVMRQGLALDPEVLEAAEQETLRGRSLNTLRYPWGSLHLFLKIQMSHPLAQALETRTAADQVLQIPQTA